MFFDDDDDIFDDVMSTGDSWRRHGQQHLTASTTEVCVATEPVMGCRLFGEKDGRGQSAVSCTKQDVFDYSAELINEEDLPPLPTVLR